MGKKWDSFSPSRVAARAESVRRKSTEKASEHYQDRFGGSQGGGVPIKYDESPDANRRFQAWCESWACECLRVLKPGGHLLACGGTRTHHRLVCGIEDAGFEIRDRIDTPSGSAIPTPDGTLAWYFGSGFPKGKDVHKTLVAMGQQRSDEWLGCPYGAPGAEARRDQIEAAVSELEHPVEDAEWDGWNVALKPAHEPIVVARKPLIGTVAENVLEHGTGGINVDGCRTGFVSKADESETKEKNRHADFGSGARENRIYGEDSRERGEHGNYDASGRWPANIVLSEEAAIELDAQTGVSVSRIGAPRSGRSGEGWGMRATGAEYDDRGGASRFFYCAKTSRAERNAGLTLIQAKALNWSNGDQSPGTFQSGGTERLSANYHPTVKPINLMRWLVRLVTPGGGACA